MLMNYNLRSAQNSKDLEQHLIFHFYYNFLGQMFAISYSNCRKDLAIIFFCCNHFSLLDKLHTFLNSTFCLSVFPIDFDEFTWFYR